MNQPPGNPTDPQLEKLHEEVAKITESMANCQHQIWLNQVEQARLKKNLKAAKEAIETITKPKE